VLEEKSVITKPSYVTLCMQKESRICVLYITKESKKKEVLLRIYDAYFNSNVSKKCKLITMQCPLKKFLIKFN